MLSFAVFDGNAPAREWPLRHAHLFGADDIPLQGQIRFESGVIACEKSGTETAGLCIQLAVEGASPAGGAKAPSLGMLTLKTCLLPERQEPYLLSLELARHQIMLFLNKLEDWGLFDDPAAEPILADFERARQAFTDALVAQRHDTAAKPGEAASAFSPEADALAKSSLALCVDAGERLTLLQAEKSMPGRISGQTYAEALAHLVAVTQEPPPAMAPVIVPGSGMAVVSGPPQIGCAASPSQFAEPLQRVIAASCDFLCMPMRWLDLEPTEGKYSFAGTDRWIEWAVRTARLPVTAGPVIDLRPGCIPEWLYIWENDYDTLRELVVEHVQNVVTRYRRTVSRWTVVSGLNVNTNFKLGFEQIIDLTKLTVVLVRKLHPAAKVQVEIAQPFGEYHALNRRSVPPLLFADAVGQIGLGIDAISLRIQIGSPRIGQTTRDLMTLSALVDRYAAFEKPISITAIGAPSAGAPVGPAPHAPTTLGDGGFWRRPWSEPVQADWMTRVFAILLSKPFVQSVCWQELSDGLPHCEMPLGGLVAVNAVPKPAAMRLAQIRQYLRENKSLRPLFDPEAGI